MIYLMMQKNGLGNQLFAYAYARLLQARYANEGIREDIQLNSYHFHDGIDNPNIDERHISLQHFRLNEHTRFLPADQEASVNSAFATRTHTATSWGDRIREKLLKQPPTGEDSYMRRSARGLYYSYVSHALYPTVLSNKPDKFVYGHFINAGYVEDHADLLREEFTIIDAPDAANAAMESRIRDCESVCVHIRRGDYLNERWKHLNICDAEYYQKAVDLACAELKSPRFFLFSNTHDDLEWIRANMPLTDPRTGKPLELIPVDLANPDYAELRLMAACKHFIIANSTFSWWGAFLSDSENKRVYMPDRWDLHIPGDAGMSCKGWIKVPTGK